MDTSFPHDSILHADKQRLNSVTQGREFDKEIHTPNTAGSDRIKRFGKNPARDSFPPC